MLMGLVSHMPPGGSAVLASGSSRLFFRTGTSATGSLHLVVTKAVREAQVRYTAFALCMPVLHVASLVGYSGLGQVGPENVAHIEAYGSFSLQYGLLPSQRHAPLRVRKRVAITATGRVVGIHLCAPTFFKCKGVVGA